MRVYSVVEEIIHPIKTPFEEEAESGWKPDCEDYKPC
jgi:hypothetical protein